MKENLIGALAHIYLAALDFGPLFVAMAVALWRSARFDRTAREVAIARAQDRRKILTYEEAQLERREIDRILKRKSYGWKTFAMFSVILVALYALASFVQYNAHSIVREAHKIVQANEDLEY